MGRLKALGKNTKRQASEVGALTPGGTLHGTETSNAAGVSIVQYTCLSLLTFPATGRILPRGVQVSSAAAAFWTNQPTTRRGSAATGHLPAHAADDLGGGGVRVDDDLPGAGR